MKNNFILPDYFFKENIKVTLSPITPIFKNFDPKQPIGEILFIEKVDAGYLCKTKNFNINLYEPLTLQRIGVSTICKNNVIQIISISII